MGEIKEPEPCLAFVAGFAGKGCAIDWLEQRMQSQWGPILLSSELFQFNQTSYYQRDMGEELKKRLYVFGDLFDPSQLPKRKIESNRWEREFAEQSDSNVRRPLNIDPGYMSLTKLVLASTKNRAHRIFIGEGIYAEISNRFIKETWESLPWTYDDYQTPGYLDFFNSAREALKQQLRSAM